MVDLPVACAPTKVAGKLSVGAELLRDSPATRLSPGLTIHASFLAIPPPVPTVRQTTTKATPL